jgi:hypothetical protein
MYRRIGASIAGVRTVGGWPQYFARIFRSTLAAPRPSFQFSAFIDRQCERHYGAGA